MCLKELKHIKLIDMNKIVLITAIGFLLASCTKEFVNETEGMNGEQKNTEFSSGDIFLYNTTEERVITVEYVSRSQEPLSDVYTEIYFENPFTITEMGFELVNEDVKPVFKGKSDASGILETTMSIPTRLSSVFVRSFRPGLVKLKEVPTSSEQIHVSFGNESVDSSYSESSAKKVFSEYLELGSYNALGYPHYKEPKPDKISSDLLDAISATLPESRNLFANRPDLFSEDYTTNIYVREAATVYITFVDEGAGYKNVLGYYHHDENNTPATADDIQNKIIAFPNTSLPGSGGALQSGSVVQLKFWDEEEMEFKEIFPAGTVISWFLIANGWNGYIGTGQGTLYGVPELNGISDPDQAQHTMVLYDDDRDLLLLSFEDIRRTSGGDQDFNDVVFYVRANPASAINGDDYGDVGDPGDMDEDGVPDEQDDFPTDPELAYKNTYPAGTYGTLAFEDLWPSRGDYDFNDLVVNYQFDHLAGPDNRIKYIEGRLVTRAVGAGYHNGFGFQLDASSNDISSVTGYELYKNYISLNGNGTESGLSNATIIAYDNAWGLFGYPGVSNFINTTPGAPYFEPDSMTINISLGNGLNLNEVGLPPYNPFIMVNLDRSREVHLPGYEPTEKADPTLFGTGDDTSDPLTGDYYVSAGNLPWALNLPVSFDYPVEKAGILNAYTYFESWANSFGDNFTDWYMDEPGYRNEALIYSIPE